jgi:hypothetical protein
LQNNSTSVLSEEETKQYLTPFAFKLDNSLFGLPLASPTKRGVALLIDLFLIALLSDVPGFVLALVIAVVLYYFSRNKTEGQNKIKGRKRRAIVRFSAVFVVFVVLLDLFSTIFESAEKFDPQIGDENSSLSLTQSLTLGAMTLSTMNTIYESDCQRVECWQVALNNSVVKLANVSYENKRAISRPQLDEIFNEIGEETELPLNEQKQLTLFLHDSYNKEFSRLTAQDKYQSKDENTNEELTLKQSITPVNEIKNDTTVIPAKEGEVASIDTLVVGTKEKQVYSLIEWAKGVISDLGLGFGWATFYFTAFIALGKGQTLGKKLLNIKVIQLDGTPLSFWDSFGRYGGYGAGLATGLLGFIQIYWDPNKQAIHDKISSTVVIDVKKMRLNENINLTKNSKS